MVFRGARDTVVGDVDLVVVAADDGDGVVEKKRQRSLIQLEKASKSLAITTSSLVRIPLVFQNSVKRRTRQHLPGDGDFRHTPRVWSPSVAQFAIASGNASHGPYTIGSTCSGQLPLSLFIYTFSNGVKGQLICIARAFFA